MAVLHIVLGVLLFLLGLFFILINGKSSKHQPYKGPTIYPLVGILLEFYKNRHRFLEWSTDVVSRTPTHTFMIKRPGGVRGFLTANPANVEHILKTNFDNYPKGKSFSSVLHDFLGKGIFNADGDLWKMQRKTASYEFNTKSLRNFVVETVQSEIQNRLMPVLSDSSRRGERIDLQDMLQRFAFDNICKVAFGVDPSCLHTSLPRSPFAEAFDKATDLSAGRFFHPLPQLWRLLRFLDYGSEKGLREAITVVDEFAMDIIRSRRSEMSKSGGQVREDLLSRFMAAVIANPGLADAACGGKSVGKPENSSEVERDDRFVRDMVVSFMMAGRDTTSAALTWFFWLLSSRPHVEESIRAEVSKIVALRGETMEASEGGEWAVFGFEELREMRYVQAALCESMRLCPPVPLDTKVAAADDVLPDGTFVKEGWFVSYGIYCMGRMESIWGSDYLEFKPERWLNHGELVAENPYKFPVFQAGPRVCLGKEMAFIQMKSIVASVLHSFSLKAYSKDIPKYSISITLRMQGGLPVTVQSRRVL